MFTEIGYQQNINGMNIEKSNNQKELKTYPSAWKSLELE